MTIVLAVSSLFVIAGLYVRRRWGGAALAGLAAAMTVVMSLIASGSFVTMLRFLGTSPGSEGTLVIGMMVFVQALSYGGAALAIHLTRTDDGPWLSAPRFAFGIIGFVVGAAIAFGIIMAAIVLGLAGMAQ